VSQGVISAGRSVIIFAPVGYRISTDVKFVGLESVFQLPTLALEAKYTLLSVPIATAILFVSDICFIAPGSCAQFGAKIRFVSVL
jgi:hypothetical protein